MAEFYRGEMSLRELRVLVSHLPAHSATHLAEHGEDWGSSEYLLLNIFDQIRGFTDYAYPLAHGAKKDQLGKFEPTPSPAERKRKGAVEPSPIEDDEGPQVTRREAYEAIRAMRQSNRAL